MRKKSFMPKMMSHTLLIVLFSFVCASTSFAQESFAEKIDYVKALFGGYMSSSEDEQNRKIISYFDNCTEEQKEAILSYMVQAITDSLKAENKQFAMNYIDYYRLIASPDDEYLSSLVVTEGRYYYEQMDASKLSELSDYLNNIAAKSSLDYSSDIAELNRMREEVIHGCDDLIGYWVMDISDKENEDIRFVDIYKDNDGEYHVDIIYYPFLIEDTCKSVECQQSLPGRLSFCWYSENMKIGKEELASFLRSGVRNVSNSIIGEVAKSNTYSFGTTLLGSIGAMLGEVMLNSLIDGLTLSKKTIRTITGDIDIVNKNVLSASFSNETYKFRSDNSDVEMNHRESRIDLIRYNYDDDYVKNNIVFFMQGLRQHEILSKKERKAFYKQHPEVKKAMRRFSWSFRPFKAARAFNREQVRRLKKYNKTH